MRRTRNNLPEIDKEALVRIQKLIELENDENGKHLAAFLHWIQVSSSRSQGHIKDYCEPTNGSRTRVFTRNNALFPIIAIVQLHLRISVLFPYARGEIEEINQSYVFGKEGNFREAVIANSLSNLGLQDELEEEDYKSILSNLQDVDVFTGKREVACPLSIPLAPRS